MVDASSVQYPGTPACAVFGSPAYQYMHYIYITCFEIHCDFRRGKFRGAEFQWVNWAGATAMMVSARNKHVGFLETLV